MMPFIFPVINEISRKIAKRKFVRSIVVPDGTEIHCLKFGKGQPLLIVLGIGDGVRTVKDISLILMFSFLSFARKHQVVIMSRRAPLGKHMTVELLADDFFFVTNELGLKDIFIWGNSVGGPIAQAMALLNPDKVKGLILNRTLCRPNKEFIEKVEVFIDEFKQHNLKRFIVNTVPFQFKTRTLKRLNHLCYLLADRLTRRYGKKRVFHILDTLVTFDHFEANKAIQCPVLIFIDKNDSLVPFELQQELVTSFSGPEVITTSKRGEGHFLQLRSFFRFRKEIDRFISENKNKAISPNS